MKKSSCWVVKVHFVILKYWLLTYNVRFKSNSTCNQCYQLIFQDAEKKADEEKIRTENILKGNPLMNQEKEASKSDFKVKRR